VCFASDASGQTDKQTYLSQHFAPLPGGEANISQTEIYLGRWLSMDCMARGPINFRCRRRPRGATSFVDGALEVAHHDCGIQHRRIALHWLAPTVVRKIVSSTADITEQWAGLLSHVTGHYDIVIFIRIKVQHDKKKKRKKKKKSTNWLSRNSTTEHSIWQRPTRWSVQLLHGQQSLTGRHNALNLQKGNHIR